MHHAVVVNATARDPVKEEENARLERKKKKNATNAAASIAHLPLEERWPSELATPSAVSVHARNKLGVHEVILAVNLVAMQPLRTTHAPHSHMTTMQPLRTTQSHADHAADAHYTATS